MKNIFLSLLLLSLCSCIQVAQFARDHLISNPGKSKAVNFLEYELLGTVGADQVWVQNQYGQKVKLSFEAVGFPTDKELSDEFLFKQDDLNRIKTLATMEMKNYFGSHKMVHLITLKVASYDNRDTVYLLDAVTENRQDTLAEVMVLKGYYYVYEDIVKSARYKHLLKLQEKAQQSQVGMWKKVKAYNPMWHD
jgi:hypothetical protein